MSSVLIEPLCAHKRKIGDNYGVSCQTCGERLAGYGYWAHESDCWHYFIPVNPDQPEDGEICMYCEMWRKSQKEQETE